MPRKEALVVCKIPMGYGRYTRLDRGQIFALEGKPNDARLLRFGYVTELEKDAETYECAECGAPFASMDQRAGHARLRHPNRELSVEDIERMEDREQSRLEEEFRHGELLALPTE